MMAECDEMFLRVNKKAQHIFLRIPEECQKTLDWMINYRKDIQTKLLQIQTENYNIPILPKTPRPRVKRAKRHVQTSSDEDHITLHAEKTSDITDSSIHTSGKPKRNASKLAEQKIIIQSQQKLNTKMRRPEKNATVLNDISNNAIILNIKSEKKTESPLKDPVPEIELQPAAKEIKKENMPPPAFKPKKGRKKIKKEVESSDTENEGGRVTRSKRAVKTSSTSTRSTRTTSKTRHDSDVIIQETPVPVVVIDSDTEDNASQNSEVESNTETSKQVDKDKDKEQVESTAGDTDDDLPLKPRKTKRKVKKAEPKSKKTQQETAKTIEAKDNSIYEDALPVISNNKQLDLPSKTKGNVKNGTLENTNLNVTHVIQKDSINLNSTRVITKSTLNETHVISKDNEPPLKHKNTLLMDCSVVLQKMNETVTLPKSNANQTVVLSPRVNHWKKPDVPPPVDNLLTDDDDSIFKATPEKKPEPPRKGIKTKQMFSPYSNSPVRKRVAAFEKLVTNDVDIPNRVTRTKTRNMEKDNQQQSSSESSGTKIPSKSKYFTPTINNKLPSLIPQSDTKKGNKISTIQVVKSASAIKPSRAEAQIRREEDQKKRLEKEEEAKKKREAIMLAKAEEQRKKREEKQLKAQKAREEMEREKEEKLRQMIQEKEEEQQRKREWQAKKMAEIEERKKAEEQVKLLKMRELEKQRLLDEKRKKQLASKPPPLPTEDCEDSDSSSESAPRKPKYLKPQWAQYQNQERSMIDEKYIRTCRFIQILFKMQATTPDLREIFEAVDERLLRRNSSAVWRTPPRYSTLPKF